jgi:hypothetical protein
MTEEELREFAARGQRAQEAAQTIILQVPCPGVAPPEPSPQAATASRRPRRGPNPETALHDLIARALRIHPAVAWLVRMNTGQFEIDGRRIRAAFVGCPDLLGQMSTGELLAVEVKRPGRGPTTEQAAVLSRISKHGGFACCAHSTAEALDAVEEWKRARQNRLASQRLRSQ